MDLPESRVVLVLLHIILDSHGDRVGLLGVHGVDEAHDHALVPIPGHEGVHVAFLGHGLEQAVEELDDRVRVPVVVRVHGPQIGQGRDTQVGQARPLPRLGRQQHVDQTHILGIGAGRVSMPNMPK